MDFLYDLVYGAIIAAFAAIIVSFLYRVIFWSYYFLPYTFNFKIRREEIKMNISSQRDFYSSKYKSFSLETFNFIKKEYPDFKFSDFNYGKNEISFLTNKIPNRIIIRIENLTNEEEIPDFENNGGDFALSITSDNFISISFDQKKISKIINFFSTFLALFERNMLIEGGKNDYKENKLIIFSDFSKVGKKMNIITVDDDLSVTVKYEEDRLFLITENEENLVTAFNLYFKNGKVKKFLPF
ncbi:MAG: hypothetical protein HeimC3_17040 [Candidatus Heimdallarchaeota archaeon LC_3]|nr:MAG: hypothetical protein HeimC3_17040 [Candidatus Heimdallarchaeota archaeon LC_3]